MYPLDVPLGMGAHVIIRAAIGTRARTYSPSPFVRDHAQNLVAAGCTWQDARRLLLRLITNVGPAADFTQAVNLAVGLFQAPNGWTYANVERCVDACLAANNAQTGAEWAAIGRALGVNQAVNTIAFARIQNWNHASILQLAQGFAGANPNNFVAQQWIQIATSIGNNQPAAANAFAAINGWTMQGIRRLIASFNLQAHGFTGVEWATLAGRFGQDADADATAFAAIANWNFAAIDQLAQNRAAGNPNNFTVQQWVTLAGSCAHHDHAAATAFARINGWTLAGVQALAQAYVAANPRNFTPAEWAAIAAELGADQHANATSFARMANWSAAGARQLAHEFHAGNANNHTAAEWVTLGVAVGNNLAAETAALARTRGRGNTAWNHASALQVAQNRLAGGGNPNNFSVAQWVAVAAVLPANQHANVTTFAQAAGWNHAPVVALATLFGNNAYGQTAANWIAMAPRIGGPNWAQYTANAMLHRSRGWPDQVNIRTVALGPTAVWNLEGSNDGLVYRRTGVGNPHITIHNLQAGPDNWWQAGGDFHVVTGGPNSPFDHYRRVYQPFLAKGQQMPVRPPAVIEIVDSFCTSLGH